MYKVSYLNYIALIAKTKKVTSDALLCSGLGYNAFVGNRVLMPL
ncbi:MAG: hypothetical protein ACI9YH_004323 [Colwellia sp.]|jgi:hypothetical protein